MSEEQAELSTSSAEASSKPGSAGVNAPGLATRVPRIAVLALTSAWILTLLVVFCMRVGFPLELEWMEGGVLHQALRLQQGLAIYPEPSADFIPFLYTPLYPALLAALGLVFPLDYALGRVVSVLAFAAVGLGLWRLVGRAGKPRSHRAAAVGLWAAGYVFSFRWYDIARADTLLLALLVWGLTLQLESGREPSSSSDATRSAARKAVLAGVLMGLAFWTKQTAAVFVFASGVAALLWARRHLWRYVLTIAIVVLPPLYIGQWVTDTWLWTYIYELHQTHAFNAERFYKKTWGMFLHAAPWLALLVIARLADWGARLVTILALAQGTGSEGAGVGARLRSLAAAIQARPDAAHWGALAAVGLLVSALGYSTQWAEPNAFMPGVCFGAAFIAVALPQRGRGERAGLWLVAAQLLFALTIEPRYQPIQSNGVRAGLFQDSYTWLWREPQRTVPSAAQREAAAALRAELQGGQGEVFAFQRPWWSVLSGGAGHVGSMGVNDIPIRAKRRVQGELRKDIMGGRYQTLWFEGRPPNWIGRTVLRNYTLERRLQGDARVRPLTGYMSEAGMVTPYRGEQRKYVRKPGR